LGSGAVGGYMLGGGSSKQEEEIKKLKGDQFRNNLLSAALGAGVMWYAKDPIKGALVPTPTRSTRLPADEFDEIWKSRRRLL